MDAKELEKKVNEKEEQIESGAPKNKKSTVKYILRADHVRDLVERAVVHLVERPQDTALDGFQAVVDVRDGAVLDDVGGVLDEVAVHHLPQALVRHGFDRV